MEIYINKKNYILSLSIIEKNSMEFQSNDDRIRSLNRKIKLHAFNVCFKGSTYRREEIKLKYSLIENRDRHAHKSKLPLKSSKILEIHIFIVSLQKEKNAKNHCYDR